MQPRFEPVDEPDDHELLAAVRQGSHPAFAMLVRRHSERYYRLAYRYMRQRQASEDLVQDAFLKLWESPEKFRPEQNVRFTTWFYRVVVNLCLDALKRHKPLPLDPNYDPQDERPSADLALQQNEAQLWLERSIAALPERQRTALNLCFYEGVSNQEAADIMGVKLKALQSLLMRAKQTLKESYLTREPSL